MTEELPPATVLVVIPSDHVAENLVGSGALKDLSEHSALHFLAAPAVSFPLPDPCTSLVLSSVTSRVRRRLDLFFWFHALFRHFHAAGDDHRTSFKVAQLRPLMRVVHEAVSMPLLAAAVSALDRWFFFRHDAAALRLLQKIRPALVLAPGSALDSYSHMVLRSASHLGIPTAMVVTHWDYFSKKGLLRVDPEKIYVWGEDMARLAVENQVPEEALRVVGAPHFEKYLRAGNHARERSRAALGFRSDDILLLFAGIATPFDEVSVLRELSEIVETEKQDSRITIIYRPHPRAWSRKSAETAAPESLPHVLLNDALKRRYPDVDYDQHLLHAINAIVSPFSTMILEAGLCGNPAFCVGFSDEVNSWDFVQANNVEHIQALSGRGWLSVCRERSRLKQQFSDFLVMLRRGVPAEAIKAEVKKTIYFDERPYGARLLAQLLDDFPQLNKGHTAGTAASTSHLHRSSSGSRG